MKFIQIFEECEHSIKIHFFPVKELKEIKYVSSENMIKIKFNETTLYSECSFNIEDFINFLDSCNSDHSVVYNICFKSNCE